MGEENKDLQEETLEEELEESELEEKEEVQVEEESGELLKLQEENKNLMDKLLRLQADFVNYKKRAEEDKKRTIAFAVENLVSDLLPIVDNFERAIESHENKEEPFYEGVSLIYDNILNLLKNNGVEELDCLGEDFDPNKHHAVLMEESEDYDEGKVIEILQKGYIMKSKVIRPAMVKVSK